MFKTRGKGSQVVPREKSRRGKSNKREQKDETNEVIQGMSKMIMELETATCTAEAVPTKRRSESRSKAKVETKSSPTWNNDYAREIANSKKRKI